MTYSGGASLSTVKEQVRKLAESLPANATWDQAIYELYVRQKIAKAKKPSSKGASFSTKRSRGASPKREHRVIRAGHLSSSLRFASETFPLERLASPIRLGGGAHRWPSRG